MSREFLTVKILERFMSAEEMADFLTKYDSVLKKSGKAMKEVTDEDRRILIDFRAGRTISQLAKFYGCSTNKILLSIARASR